MLMSQIVFVQHATAATFCIVKVTVKAAFAKCCMFGVLQQVIWHVVEGPYKTKTREERMERFRLRDEGVTFPKISTVLSKKPLSAKNIAAITYTLISCYYSK